MGNEEDADGLPSQLSMTYPNALPLVLHDRDPSNQGEDSLMSNGSLALELQAEEGMDPMRVKTTKL